MKVLLGLLLASFTFSGFAAEGVVIVLEAPVFKEPKLDALVVQHFRKGDTIWLHPTVTQEDHFRELAPSDRLARKIKPEIERLNSEAYDELMEERPQAEGDQGQFIATKDKQGRDAYVLREHVYIYYEDIREIGQTAIPQPDYTDYRLQEPLPEKYPLAQTTGYRGSLTLSIGNAFTGNYPYTEKVSAKGFSQQYDFTGIWSKRVSRDLTDRWYWGGLFTFRAFTNDFVLQTRKAQETWIKFGIGPMISWDVHKGEHDRLSLISSVIIFPFTQAKIYQKELYSAQEDRRTYQAFSLAPRFMASYQRKKLIADLDLVLGTWAEAETPQNMRVKNAASKLGWWRDIGHDNFRTSVTFTLAGFVGIQSSY